MYLTFGLKLIDISVCFLKRKKFYVFSNAPSFKIFYLSLKLKIYQDFYKEFKDTIVRFFLCSTVFCHVGNCKACSKTETRFWMLVHVLMI